MFKNMNPNVLDIVYWRLLQCLLSSDSDDQFWIRQNLRIGIEISKWDTGILECLCSEYKHASVIE